MEKSECNHRILKENMRILMLVFLALVTLGCAAQKKSTQTVKGKVKKAANVAENNNRFAFDLYDQIGNGNKENQFFSPFSISTALAMTFAGADGETAKEMKEVLYFEENTPQFHQDYGSYLSALKNGASKYAELNIANRLYPDQSFKFKSSFLDDIGKNYGAGIDKMDFRGHSEESRKIINSWVEKQTKEKIKNLLPSGSVNPDTRMVLVNAIYFKADWRYSFNKERTKEDNFNTEGLGKVKTDFMNAKRNMHYTEEKNYKMVRLPYKGQRHSMIVVLPKGNKKLKSVEDSFDYSSIDNLYRGQNEVIFKMPKFEMTIPLGLKQPLQEMGMTSAFNKANFKKMSDEGNLAISDVIHKAFVKVDEEGTEAAAATAVTITTTSISVGPDPKPKEFIADHPFMFFIVDDQTKNILFMGRIQKP